MSNTTETSFPRRRFLKGAVTTIGVSSMGFGPLSALAGAASGRTVTVAYWDGNRLVSANLLPTGDSFVTTAKLTIRGYNESAGSIQAIDTTFVLQTTTGYKQAPFTAWIVPPVGARATQYIQRVDSRSSLGFRVQMKDSSGAYTTPVQLSTGGGLGLKLKVGYYVILEGSVDPAQFVLDTANLAAPLTRKAGSAAMPQYLLLRVEQVD